VLQKEMHARPFLDRHGERYSAVNEYSRAVQHRIGLIDVK
jgi:hypothetical protein